MAVEGDDRRDLPGLPAAAGDEEGVLSGPAESTRPTVHTSRTHLRSHTHQSVPNRPYVWTCNAVNGADIHRQMDNW